MIAFALITILEISQDILVWLHGPGLRILLILVGAWFVRRILGVVIHTVLRRAVHLEQAVGVDLDREKRMQTFASLINAVLSVAIWIMAILLALQEIGINTGPLLAGAGVLGVGLAFGTQSLVKDFVTGLFIALENQYRVGDQVELDTTKGTVEHLGIRTTVLRDSAGNIHFVPNGSIVRTVNKSMGFTELKLKLLLSRPADHQDLRPIINTLGQKMQQEKKWQPQFGRPFEAKATVASTDTTIEYIISGQVKNAYRNDAFQEFQKRLQSKLERRSIKIKKFYPEIEEREAHHETD